MSIRSFASGFVLSSLALLTSVSTQPTAAQEATFEGALEVNVVNVEVFVTDKKGNPVYGLTAGDFQLFEDGDRVEISNFLELRPEDAEAALTKIDDDDATSTPGQRIVLFLDDFAFAPNQRQDLVGKLKSYVEGELGEGAEVAVVSYDGSLRMHQPFTSDRRAVVAALDELAAMNPRAAARYAERQSVFRSGLEVLRDIQATARSGDDAQREDTPRMLKVLTQEVDAEAALLRAENRRTLYELSQLINALGSLPGRKAVVHVSQGMSARPWDELYQAIRDGFDTLRIVSDLPQTNDQRQADIDQRSSALGAIDAQVSGKGKDRGQGIATELREITALANSSQVSFYTVRPFVDAAGIPAEFSGSIAALYTPGMRTTRDANLRETAQTLAEATGGISLAGSDLSGLLARAEQDFRGYYSLAFRGPPDRAPGYHDVQVKVKGRGYRVRHRMGYFDKPPEARFGDRASAALLLAEGDNPIGIEIDLGTVRAADEPGQKIATLLVIIPLEKLTLSATDDGRWTADGQIYLAAADEVTGTAPVQLIDLQIPIEAASEAEARADRYGARMEILVSAGEPRVAVGFVDKASGLESYVSRQFVVSP